MCNACSGAKFAKKAAKVLEITSHTKPVANAANRTSLSVCDLYIGADTGDILLTPNAGGQSTLHCPATRSRNSHARLSRQCGTEICITKTRCCLRRGETSI